MAKTPQIGNTIRVNDRMQKRYSYVIEARPGRDFASGFTPFYTPKEMLALGVFEGKYCNDCRRDLPESWFKGAKLAMVADPSLNCFRRRLLPTAPAPGAAAMVLRRLHLTGGAPHAVFPD
jgi:hypothetical protein